MQENNFEKEVRKKLDELSLTPSAPVWQRVEASIKKKRERRLLFWLLPALLVAIGFVWWQVPAWQSEAADQQRTASVIQPASTFSKPHRATPDEKTERQIIKPQSLTVQKQRGKNNSIVKSRHRAGTTFTVVKKPVPVETISNVTSAIATAEKLDNGSRVKGHKNAAVYNQADQDIVETSSVPIAQLESDTAVNVGTKNQEAVTKSDSVRNHKDSVKIDVPPSKNHILKKRLQWSVVSRTGASNIVAPLTTGFGMNKSFRFDARPDYSTGIPTNNNGGSGPDTAIRRQPATPTRWLHLAIGVHAKKQLGKNSFLVAGLQYGFYSNHLVVGMQLPDDSVNNLLNRMPEALNGRAYGVRKVFLNGTSDLNGGASATYNTRFTNAFHFIELPIGFEYQLLKKRPLRLQHGFTLSRLIGSKALQYDSRANMYYQSKTGLCKTGFNVFTAADYTVWKGRTYTLQAGPHLQYGLRDLFENRNGAHLLSGGVQVNVAF